MDERTRTHHLTELDGRVSHLIPNPNRDLIYKSQKKELVNCTSHLEPEKRKKKSRHAQALKRSTASEVWGGGAYAGIHAPP